IPRGRILGGLVLAAIGLAALFQLVRIAAFEARLRRARPAPPAVRADCRAISLRLGLERPPEVVLLEGALSPLVWALGRPRVALPAVLAEGPPAALRGVLAHELAHLARRDHLWACLDLAAAVLHFWLP